MSVHTQAITRTRGEFITTGNGNGAVPSPLDAIGGPPLELGIHLRPDLRAAIGELLVQLRVVCNSMAPSDHPRAYCVTSPGTWRSLREVSEAELCDAIRKAQRFCPALTIPGDGLSAARRIEALLEKLQALA